jgi:hypothetical protein
MKQYQSSNQMGQTIALALLLASATAFPGLAADSGTTADQNPLVQAQVGANAGVQLNTGSGGGGANADVSVGGDLAVGTSTTVGSSSSRKPDGKGHGDGKGKGGGGSDGGRAPVPEPATWIGLGSLLALSVWFVALERRKHKTNATGTA